MPVTVTEEMVDYAIDNELDYKLGKKTTVVILQLNNGFEIVGTSSCVDANNYDHEIGKKYARERAITKLWELLGFYVQETQLNGGNFTVASR